MSCNNTLSRERQSTICTCQDIGCPPHSQGPGEQKFERTTTSDQGHLSPREKGVKI